MSYETEKTARFDLVGADADEGVERSRKDLVFVDGG
tara:strand:- start:370 stop:477 length:108 start_codon:yes stop_codon:yes gene_type:complete